jgi:hypothetical protein
MSESFQFPFESVLSLRKEQVSTLLETDHVIQLILLVSIHSIDSCQAIRFIGPSPVASMPADSETKMGNYGLICSFPYYLP